MDKLRKMALFAAVIFLFVAGIRIFVFWVDDSASSDIKSGDFTTSVLKVRFLANVGIADSQLLLGNLYAYGVGVPKNQKEAMYWFKRADPKNSGACAAFYVARDYLDETNSNHNIPLGQSWMEIAKTGGCENGK